MSAFFHWGQEFQGSKLEIDIPNQHSVNHWAERWRAHWGIRRKTLRQGARHNGDPQTKGWSLFFAFCGPISGVEIWTQNWVHQVAQQLKSCRKPDPVFGPPKLAWFVPGPACCNLFSPCRVTVFWRMARYVDAKFADKEVLFLNADETSVQEHLMASLVRPQQAAAFDEQPFQFPGL